MSATVDILLVDDEPLKIELSVSEKAVRVMKEGQPVTVTAVANPCWHYPATVTRIGAAWPSAPTRSGGGPIRHPKRQTARRSEPSGSASEALTGCASRWSGT